MSSIIYEPTGKAREYADLACNVYSGCDHGCLYCFAPAVTVKKRVIFETPKVRPGEFLKKLEKEASERKVSYPILLCFTTDPYQTFDIKEQVTRQAIQILHQYGHHVTVLTKGGSRALRDLDLFTPKDAFATTLTCLDPVKSMIWEPGAASPKDRISTIHKFYNAGIPTWVSLEPVLYPEDALAIIQDTHDFVGLYKIGKLNYHADAKLTDWFKFAANVTSLLDRLGCKYMIMNDLKPYLPVKPAV